MRNKPKVQMTRLGLSEQKDRAGKTTASFLNSYLNSTKAPRIEHKARASKKQIQSAQKCNGLAPIHDHGIRAEMHTNPLNLARLPSD
jgi:hypothetical protein